MRRSFLLKTSVFATLMGACSGAPEAPVETAPKPLEAREPLATAEPPLTAEPPRVADATLTMAGDGLGALALRLGRTEAARVSKDNGGKAAFALNFGEDGESLAFNDLGEKPDVNAGDGVFSGFMPIDVGKLKELNGELAQTRVRAVTRFSPGTREVIGREEISPIDLEALLAGKPVRLPRIAELGPFRVLGGILGGGAAINPQKSLFITQLPVIEDPGRTMNPCRAAAFNSPLKKWTFGYLMNEMAQGSGLTPEAFTEQWLNHWRAQQVVTATGGAPVLDVVNNPSLANMDNLVINPWRARSGGGPLDLSIAPFRLQAIIYRADLAKSSPYGGGGKNNAGELRFVFGLMEARDMNADGDALDPGDTCQAREMAVIFEYGVPISTCQGIKDWANQWVALTALLPGTPAYGAALEALTEAVVKHGAAPAKPNQNALNQLRANEIDLSGIWQMREFVITAGGGPLFQTTVKNNPREHQAAFTATGATPAPIDLNGTFAFRNELVANLPAILAGTYTVPELSAGAPFLGGASTYNFNTAWDHPALATPAELNARFKFSFNTCSGCHTGETQTAFYHVRPTGPGSTPILSSFLTANPHNVVDVRGIPHTFNEMDNRKQALSNLANQTCKLIGVPPFQVLRPSLLSVH